MDAQFASLEPPLYMHAEPPQYVEPEPPQRVLAHIRRFYNLAPDGSVRYNGGIQQTLPLGSLLFVVTGVTSKEERYPMGTSVIRAYLQTGKWPKRRWTATALINGAYRYIGSFGRECEAVDYAGLISMQVAWGWIGDVGQVRIK